VDLAILQRIARELDDLLPGGFVNKIHQPLPRDLVLRIRRGGLGEKKLMIGADPGLPRLHLTELKIPNPPSPPRFCAFLRAHFQGSKILQITADDHDRVVRIAATRGPEGQRIRRELILELLGRDANIILVESSSNVIMDCLHRIPPKETGTRAVMPGLEYAPPPLARGRSFGEPEETRCGAEDPGIAALPNGKSRLVLSVTGPNDRAFSTMNLAAEAFYCPKLETALLESHRRGMTAPVRTRVRSLERRLAKIQADGERLRALAARQAEGELLKANLRLVRKGMDHVEVQDWETGRPRTIFLEPALTAVENMERIFRKCAKGKRGEQKVQERRNQTLEEMRALQDLLYFMDRAADVEELDRLVLDAQPSAPSAGRTSQKTRAARTGEPQLFHGFPLSQGRQVLVGRSASGNDVLLRRKARAGDLWLHVKDFSGAHVLLPSPGKEGPPQEDIDYAAALAVRYSKARGKGKVEVMMASVSDVETVRGGFKGQVTVKRYRIVLSDGALSADPPA
jgi:predicted ribosome quality control (RQC) complex YloA/Tae2 family protein